MDVMCKSTCPSYMQCYGNQAVKNAFDAHIATYDGMEIEF